ncbi:MAG: hypothetical protein AAFY33_21385, partial [Cyanobacteria bacterium J06643_4]
MLLSIYVVLYQQHSRIKKHPEQHIKRHIKQHIKQHKYETFFRVAFYSVDFNTTIGFIGISVSLFPSLEQSERFPFLKSKP